MSDSDDKAQSSDGASDEYVVEKIVGRKTERGKIMYRVKWKGYSESENTWEPKENCDCPDLIESFEKEEEERKKTTTDKKPGSRNKGRAPTKTTSKKRKRVETPESEEESSDASDNDVKIVKPKRGTARKRGQASSSDEEDKSSTKSDMIDKVTKKRTYDSDYENPLDSDDDNAANPRPSTSRAATARKSQLKPTSKQNTKSAANESIRENQKGDDSDGSKETVHFGPSSKEIETNDLEPEKILGATEKGDELMFLVKWKNMNKADLISSRIAKIACPQTIIEFFESRIRWNSGDAGMSIEIANEPPTVAKEPTAEIANQAAE